METIGIFPAGRLRNLQLGGVADALSVAMVPDVLGTYWVVLDAWAYHDDTSARAITWFYYSSTVGAINKTASGSIAAAVRWPLCVNGGMTANMCTGSPISNGVCYANVSVPALTGGKKLFIEALVLELPE